MDILPDNKTDNLHLFVLDPLSVIIKLAILSNKPIGTKIRIDNNIIYWKRETNTIECYGMLS